MFLRKSFALLFLASSLTVNAFVPLQYRALQTQVRQLQTQHSATTGSTTPLADEAAEKTDGKDIIIDTIRKEANYKPGEANTDFARRYKHLVGAKLKTVGEAFADFNRELGYTINPLYKGLITDFVGTTHLIVVSSRFVRDPVWCLGIVTALELLLRNYPEKEIASAISTALFKSMNMDEAEVHAEGRKVTDWVQGKSLAEVEAALKGETDDGPLARVGKAIRSDKYWMYSRYFGLGLIKVMEMVGVEQDKDEAYPVMERWMNQYLGRPYLSACSDSDMYFKVKDKLEMMETMMKEIEIREKKRMAERLEAKAEAALRAADKEEKMQSEIEAEAAKNRERVSSS